MLAAATRLTRRDDFATAVRRGRRAACGCVVVHLARGVAAGPPTEPVIRRTAVPKVGFVVGRTVGGSVVRHRVQRRLRHLMRCRLATLPAGALVVVRALPASAEASSATLGADLDAALRRLTGSRSARSPAGSTSGAAHPGGRT